MSPNPDMAATMLDQGVRFLQQGLPEVALDYFDRALAIKPRDAGFLSNRGSALLKLHRTAEALESFNKALAIAPQVAMLHFNRAGALARLERLAESIAAYEEAIRRWPEYAEAYNNIGNVQLKLGNAEAALSSFDHAISIRGNYSEAHSNRGFALFELKRMSEALASHQRALSIRPDHARAMLGSGDALLSLNRPEDALRWFDRALELRAGDAKTFCNRGLALLQLRKPMEALAAFDIAMEMDPADPNTLNNRGNAFLDLDCTEEALANYGRALDINPRHVDALKNSGDALAKINRPRDAALCFELLLEENPDYDYAHGSLVNARLQYCDWLSFQADTDGLMNAVRSGLSADQPFYFLAVSSSAPDQLICARNYMARRYPTQPAMRSIERYAHDRIRVAYISADYRQHAVAHLLTRVLESHDRTRFEPMGISLRPDRDSSELGKRIRKALPVFHEVHALSDRDIAALLRELEVDIAVDLGGHTGSGRPGILSFRPAPLQAGFLGYPGTLGAEFIDYLIADKVVIPPGEEGAFAEKIVRMPHCFLPTGDTRPLAELQWVRSEAGLPAEGFVFCAFHGNYKIAPQLFAVWMHILGAVPDSVLWLRATDEDTAANLGDAAVASGIAPDRLVFAPVLKGMGDHLSRYRLADLFLDTSPYNAHTTASDALRENLPVLTCRGTTFAGRVASSLLQAAGLTELIADSLEEYERAAIRLANDAGELRTVRARLQAALSSSPVFDSERYCRDLERAYEEMWHRQQRGEAPDHFNVPASC